MAQDWPALGERGSSADGDLLSVEPGAEEPSWLAAAEADLRSSPSEPPAQAVGGGQVAELLRGVRLPSTAAECMPAQGHEQWQAAVRRERGDPRSDVADMQASGRRSRPPLTEEA